MPDVAERLAAIGFQTETSTPEVFAEHIDSETVKWDRVIKAARIPTD